MEFSNQAEYHSSKDGCGFKKSTFWVGVPVSWWIEKFMNIYEISHLWIHCQSSMLFNLVTLFVETVKEQPRKQQRAESRGSDAEGVSDKDSGSVCLFWMCVFHYFCFFVSSFTWHQMITCTTWILHETSGHWLINMMIDRTL